MRLSDGSVQRISTCSLRCGDEPWPFAEANRPEIERHWARKAAENAGFFNGPVLIMLRHRVTGRHFEGTYTRTDFASFLCWRENRPADDDVRDGFGSAILRSAEGHVLLGRQGGGNLNAGRTYFPGGFVDPRDIRADGSIDIAASVRRELREETGLDPEAAEQTPGFLLSVSGVLISIGVEFRFPLPANALRSRIIEYLRGEAEPELSDIVIARGSADIDDVAMPAFTTQVLREILPAR